MTRKMVEAAEKLLLKQHTGELLRFGYSVNMSRGLITSQGYVLIEAKMSKNHNRARSVADHTKLTFKLDGKKISRKDLMAKFDPVIT